MSLCPRCGEKIDKNCKVCGIILNNYCSLCDYITLKRRTFYEDDKNSWICFLAAPYHTEGHSILVPIDKEVKEYTIDSCKFTNENYKTFKEIDDAFSAVSQSLMEYYKNRNPNKGKITNLLYASVCGDEAHFHVHINPRWSNDEKKWRKSKKIFEKGHLFSFLSFLELEADENAKIERAINGWCKIKQRFELIKKFEENKTIEDLKSIAEKYKNKIGKKGGGSGSNLQNSFKCDARNGG